MSFAFFQLSVHMDLRSPLDPKPDISHNLAIGSQKVVTANHYFLDNASGDNPSAGDQEPALKQMFDPMVIIRL